MRPERTPPRRVAPPSWPVRLSALLGLGPLRAVARHTEGPGFGVAPLVRGSSPLAAQAPAPGRQRLRILDICAPLPPPHRCGQLVVGGIDEVMQGKQAGGRGGQRLPGPRGGLPSRSLPPACTAALLREAPPCSPPQPQPLPLSGPPPGRPFQCSPPLPTCLVRRGNPRAPLGEVLNLATVRTCSLRCGSVELLIEAGVPVFSSCWNGSLPRRLPQHSALAVRRKSLARTARCWATLASVPTSGGRG